jgi:hypothetical protein
MSIRITSPLIAMIASVTAINASVPIIVGYGKGRLAVKDAKAACSIMAWTDKSMIDTLAAAYADTGDFDSAARYATQALAIKGIEPVDSKRIQRHLALFQQHQPIRL